MNNTRMPIEQDRSFKISRFVSVVSAAILLGVGCSTTNSARAADAVRTPIGSVTTANPSVGRLKVRFADKSGASGAIGSCFLIRPGVLVTCLHVISGGVQAEVTFPSGLKLPITGIVAEDSANDLALVTIKNNRSEPPPLPLAPQTPRLG